MKKKIIYLSYNDFQGGAAIASFNMFKSIPLKKYNLELNCVKKNKRQKYKKNKYFIVFIFKNFFIYLFISVIVYYFLF